MLHINTETSQTFCCRFQRLKMFGYVEKEALQQHSLNEAPLMATTIVTDAIIASLSAAGLGSER